MPCAPWRAVLPRRMAAWAAFERCEPAGPWGGQPAQGRHRCDDEAAGELEERFADVGSPFPSDPWPAEAIQPRKTPFYDPAVGAQSRAVQGAAAGDRGHDAAGGDGRSGRGPVGSRRAGAAVGYVVAVAAGQQHGERGGVPGRAVPAQDHGRPPVIQSVGFRVRRGSRQRLGSPPTNPRPRPRSPGEAPRVAVRPASSAPPRRPPRPAPPAPTPSGSAHKEYARAHLS